MFIGHYGPAAAVAGSKVKPWHGFVAVQFLDILWAPFVLLGIENVRIVENFTASNHFDLYHMPYTHSLVMAIFWSVAVGGVYAVLRKRSGLTGAIIMGALVLSHWVLDFIMHKPDLELWFGGPKVGLGLWDYRSIAIGAEIGLFLAGLAFYLSRSGAKSAISTIAVVFTIALALAAQIFGNFAPPPGGPEEAAYSAIIAYAIFALLAAWIDSTLSMK